MCPLQVLKIIDRLLRDLCHENDKRKPFGGKTILLCGDLRQILPVIPHESRGTLIENCVTSWHEFSYFRKITLTRNMRALPNEIEFVEFFKEIDNDEAPEFPPVW
jgi:PIF1 helicase.